MKKSGKLTTLSRRSIERTAMLVIMDIACIAMAYFFALLFRFDFSIQEIPAVYLTGYLHTVPIWIALALVMFVCCRLYNSLLSMASISELVAIMGAYLLLIPLYALAAWLLDVDMPRSYHILGYAISFCMTTAIRFSYRLLRYLHHFEPKRNHETKDADRVMIIGAGAAGQILIRDLQHSPWLSAKACCVIDDNPYKHGRYLEGVPIVGGRESIPAFVKKYRINRIVLAIPSVSVQEQRNILNICNTTNCRLQTIPGVYQFVNDEVRASRLRDVDVVDLLGRDQVTVNNQEIFSDIFGKIVLVTGGGGSIGSELCRQIAGAKPQQLIIFDIYENNAYAIQQELIRQYPELNLVTLIGSVRNTQRMESVMATYKPDLVFHAAAHKHVPLMEDSPNEAIKNNVIGTYKTAQAAARNGVKKFVLISTDKAVNPTNIMGASKRLCEMVVQMMDRQSENTSFVAVRFGNVLGSNGSVVPLFRKQIAAGGPVTVTDKRIIRYFMTIPEAVSLVLQASYYAEGGEIFILDMGEPVKIDDMARNLIRLSGYTPDVDIKIVYTGLRPGEKLYEEMLMKEEGMKETENHLIHIGKPIEMDDEWFKEKLLALDNASRAESEKMKQIVAEIVPTYHYEPSAKKTPVI